jgi:hypothetical protein
MLSSESYTYVLHSLWQVWVWGENETSNKMTQSRDAVVLSACLLALANIFR